MKDAFYPRVHPRMLCTVEIRGKNVLTVSAYPQWTVCTDQPIILSAFLNWMNLNLFRFSENVDGQGWGKRCSSSVPDHKVESSVTTENTATCSNDWYLVAVQWFDHDHSIREDGFASTLRIVFTGTRQIFHMYHTEVSRWRWVEVKGDWKINTTEGKGSGREGKVRPACLPGWQLTLLDVTFTVCWRFVWKPSHLWLAVWLMSLSACLCSLRRGHGLIPGITDLFAFGANLQIPHALKY